MPGQEIKIFDSNDKEVGVGQIGEIVIRGPILMQGYYKLCILCSSFYYFIRYYKNQTATNDTLKNGWLHSGTSALSYSFQTNM